MSVECFFKKVIYFIASFQKSVITSSNLQILKIFRDVVSLYYLKVIPSCESMG